MPSACIVASRALLTGVLMENSRIALRDSSVGDVAELIVNLCGIGYCSYDFMVSIKWF